MARRTVQAGYLSRQIEQLRARGLTRGQIAEQTGIGERTQRKLISGETSGRRWYRRIIPQSPTGTVRGGGSGRGGTTTIPRSAEPGHFSIVVVCTDGSYARIPIILRDYERARILTPFDKARIIRNANVQDTIVTELQKVRKGSPAKTRDEIKLCRAVDVVPIINSHTSNIPQVRLG